MGPCLYLARGPGAIDAQNIEPGPDVVRGTGWTRPKGSPKPIA
jgi:hypothetical protein